MENLIKKIVFFSPFGLGVLDPAVANFVRELGLAQWKGTMIGSFLPEPWDENH
jgi:hypothetical protein